MIEKISQFEPERPAPKIVGPASPERKEEIKKMILSRFAEGHYDQLSEGQRRILESLEYPKRPFENLAIKQANKITNSLLEEFELRPFDIPERNIHIVPEKIYKEIEKEDTDAITFQETQAIVMNAERLIHPIDKVSVILHEIIHLKNFLALEAHEDLYKPYQSGLKISSSHKKEKGTGFFVAFSGLNEAVVSEMEKNISPSLLKRLLKRMNF